MYIKCLINYSNEFTWSIHSDWIVLITRTCTPNIYPTTLIFLFLEGKAHVLCLSFVILILLVPYPVNKKLASWTSISVRLLWNDFNPGSSIYFNQKNQKSTNYLINNLTCIWRNFLQYIYHNSGIDVKQ